MRGKLLTKSNLSFLLGIAVFFIIQAISPAGLSPQGVTCLAVTLMTVVFWAGGAMSHPVYAGLVLLGSYALLLDRETVPLTTIFRFFTLPIAWLVIGSFLIAAAVEFSGVADRIAHVVQAVEEAHQVVVVTGKLARRRAAELDPVADAGSGRTLARLLDRRRVEVEAVKA